MVQGHRAVVFNLWAMAHWWAMGSSEGGHATDSENIILKNEKSRNNEEQNKQAKKIYPYISFV